MHTAPNPPPPSEVLFHNQLSSENRKVWEPKFKEQQQLKVNFYFFFPWRIPLPPALVPNSALDLCCLWQSLLKVFLRAPFLKVCCVQLMVGYGRSRAEWFGEVTEPQDFLSCVETLSPSSSRWITPFCWSWHPQRTRTQVLPYKI